MADGVKKQRLLHWLQKAARMGVLSCLQNGGDIHSVSHAHQFLYPDSVKTKKKTCYALVKFGTMDMLAVLGAAAGARRFEGHELLFQWSGGTGEKKKDFKLLVRFCPLSHENAMLLRGVFPFTAPSSLAWFDATFGTGDRLGTASSGIVRALRHFRVAPVLAQQSVRELGFTGRTFEDVLDDATWAVFREGYELPWGADGDHLKNEDAVTHAISAGYTMITADVSESIHEHFLHARARSARISFDRIPSEYRDTVKKRYAEGEIILQSGERVGFTQEELFGTVLAYKDAVEHAVRLFEAGKDARPNRGFDFELSIDETSVPTSILAHHFIAEELQRNGIQPFSIAPRFPGEFQKGIDYIGDESVFADSLRLHAAVARKFGYKLSVHSGSDKFCVFPTIGRVTGGQFHVKTSGTHWLEALGIVARLEPSFFRTIAREAVQGFENARLYYRVNVTESALDSLSSIPDAQLASVLSDPNTRQVLHITYGEILHNNRLRDRLYSVLRKHREDYWNALEKHVERHLEALGVSRH
jgi:hypothetical protein